MTQDISIIVAFLGGLVSFLSPCVLPLIPGYLSFISGVSVSQFEHAEKSQVRKVTQSSLLFVLGFTIIFVSLGATASSVGSLFAQNRAMLETVSGVLIMIFGFVIIGALKMDFLYSEKKLNIDTSKMGLWGALPLGMAFAFGWTPCLGAVLAPILAIAAETASVQRGAILLFAYSLGLGLPFILISILIQRALGILKFIRKYSHAIFITAGVILIIFGFLMATHQTARVFAPLQQYNIDLTEYL